MNYINELYIDENALIRAKFVARTYRWEFWTKSVRFTHYLTGCIVHCQPDNSANHSIARGKYTKFRETTRRNTNL